ncbi:MAG: hypothetical protein L0154_10310 [Chloroflexi bacterium]|nr:hypothetical protein [Chloroflexota bacterium]
MLLNLILDYINNQIDFVDIHSSLFTLNLIIGVVFGIGLVARTWNSYLIDSGKKKRKKAPKAKTVSQITNPVTPMSVFVSVIMAIWCIAMGIIGVIIVIFLLSEAD